MRQLLVLLKWVIPILFFLSLSAMLAWFGANRDLEGFGPVLIGANLTVAALAINFSFVTYQATEIRRFQHGLSAVLLGWCLGLLLVAMLPVAALVIDKKNVGWVGAATIPILALLSIVLVSVAKREANPVVIMAKVDGVRVIGLTC